MRRIVVICLIALWAGTAQAHKPSDSLLTLRAAGTRIEGQWDIALRDLDHAIDLDTDGDATITWGEVRGRHAAIAAYAFARLQLQSEDGPCQLDAREQLIDRHSDGAYAVLRFGADCGPRPDSVTVRYRLLFDLDPQHRGILRIGDTEQVFLFSIDSPEQRVTFGRGIAYSRLDFWRSGIRTVGAIDQLLFLAALLLPMTWRRREVPSERYQRAGSTLQVLVAFTLAHSLTLTLATQHSLSLPPDVVGVGIAASLVAAAASYLTPRLARYRWMIAFAFGLLHGIDLAVAFADSSSGTPAIVDLLSFNLGVATGQILLVGGLFLVTHGGIASQVLIRSCSCSHGNQRRLVTWPNEGGSASEM